MPDYATSLLRSLEDRATAFGNYVRSLQSSQARTDIGFSLALEMYARYADLLTRQLEQDWELARTPRQRLAAVLSWTEEFFAKESWFDERFARGRQGDVPRALKTMARREFRRQGLNRYEPVLTVGPPDNFETHKSDLARFLFSNITVERPEDRAGLPDGVRLSIISVPYIEGTRALWTPIPIGHEIGHLRIEEDRAALRHLDVREWVSEVDAELEQLIEAEKHSTQAASGVGVLEDSRRILQAWVDEVLCDLNAVRLFGPAGVSAIAEFLAVVGRSDRGAEQATKSHPPLSLRVTAMLGFLKVLGEPQAATHLQPWQEYVAGPRATFDDNISYLVDVVGLHLDELYTHALTWGELYRAAGRDVETQWLVDELLNGVPGGTHCLDGARRGSEITHQDAVVAAWVARDRLDAHDAATGDAEPPLLIRSDANRHERRIQVDDLASKAIDSVELATLWTGTGREVVNLGLLQAAPPPGDGERGILSRRGIEHRLRSSGPERIVITPLLEGAIEAAGVDVRLAPDFIVFKHSATRAFDPLDPRLDPRVMQEPVEKSWGEPFVLHPGELVLAATLEYLVLPLDIAAQVVTRSSYGRLGLITATAVQVQPGSHGCITLELVNHGETPIALTPGARVAQLVFFRVGDPDQTLLPGKYWFPTGPQFSKVQDDRDAGTLRHLGQIAIPNVPRRGLSPQSAADIRFTYTGNADLAWRFQAAAAGEGVDVHVQPQTMERPANASEAAARLGGGTELVTYVVGGLAGLRALAGIIIRLTRSLSRGVVIEVDEERNVTVKTPPGLPRGTIVVAKPDGTDVTVPGEAMVSHLAEAVADALRRPRQPD